MLEFPFHLQFQVGHRRTVYSLVGTCYVVAVEIFCCPHLSRKYEVLGEGVSQAEREAHAVSVEHREGKIVEHSTLVGIQA